MNGFISMDGIGGERKAAELIALKTQFSSSDLPKRKRERKGEREGGFIVQENNGPL